jgi:hypothetical protein
MAKVKSLLMDREEQFNSKANDLLTSSEYEQEAVNTIVALAQDMGLLEYLGGYSEIESMVLEAWYDMNYEHIAV